MVGFMSDKTNARPHLTRDLTENLVVKIYFSDFFDVDPATVEDYGAFNVSLLADLPLFIDPFLLFNSYKPEYQQLHAEIITYLKFLRDKSSNSELQDGLIEAWYRFPEIKQTWLGFSATWAKPVRNAEVRMVHIFLFRPVAKLEEITIRSRYL